MRITALTMLAAALAGGLAPCLSRAADTPAPVMDEVVVTGERAGPGLWHVHRDTAQLWIMGTVTPLPKNMTWRSKQIEEVLDTTNQVLVRKPYEIGIARALWLLLTQRDLIMVGGGKRLKDVMPADLYARFAAQRAKLGNDPDKWEHYRPIIATLFLQEAALHRVGLSTRLELGKEVRDLAHKHHVGIDEIKVAGIRDFLDVLKTMPAATENKCVAAGLATIERGLPALVDRATAWATGNVERIQNTPEPAEVSACRDAVSADAGAGDLLALMRRTWISNMLKYLQSGGVTLAVVDMDMLLEHGGILDALRAEGYEVDPP
jgi:uncharacterized protein YbaP (TraB family)